MKKIKIIKPRNFVVLASLKFNKNSGLQINKKLEKNKSRQTLKIETKKINFNDN